MMKRLISIQQTSQFDTQCQGHGELLKMVNRLHWARTATEKEMPFTDFVMSTLSRTIMSGRHLLTEEPLTVIQMCF